MKTMLKLVVGVTCALWLLGCQESSETDPVAMGYFVQAQGQARLVQLGEGGDWVLQEQLLRKAVEADPEFGRAYEALASSYWNRLGGALSLEKAAPAAHAAISSAMGLNPNSVIAHIHLAAIYLYMDLDYARAEALAEQSLEKFPDATRWFHYFLGKIALREGRIEEASKLMATAYDAGWEDAIILSAYAEFLLAVGDYEQALKFYVRRLNLAPVVGEPRAANLRSQVAALINLRRIGRAKLLLAEAWRLDGSVNPEAYISHFANVGEKERAERILADLQRDTADKYSVAAGYRDLGDVDNTFKAIEAAIEDHNILMIESLRTAEWWDEIRDDPRFGDMLKLLDSKETHTDQYLKDHSL